MADTQPTGLDFQHYVLLAVVAHTIIGAVVYLNFYATWTQTTRLYFFFSFPITLMVGKAYRAIAGENEGVAGGIGGAVASWVVFLFLAGLPCVFLGAPELWSRYGWWVLGWFIFWTGMLIARWTS